MDTTIKTDEHFMQLALEQAKIAYDKREVPVGAIVTLNGEIISCGYNLRETQHNALAHAELIAIDEACKKLGEWRLWECDLYVTLEPCPMCTGAIINSRIKRVVYGATDKKSGCFGSVLDLTALPFNHKPEVVRGVLEQECSEILSSFFRSLRIELKTREKWKKP